MSGNTANPSGSVPTGPMSVADAASALDQMMLPLDQSGEQQEVDETQLTEDDESEVAASVDEELDVQDEESSDETTEEQSEDSEESDEEDQKPEIYTVKVDGKQIEVTLDELKSGYSRTEDYRRKTTQIAETRKAVEAEAAAIRSEREQYAQLLGALQQQLESAGEQPVDWDRLYAEDPIEWVRQRELARDKQERQAAIQSEQQRLSQLTAQQRADEFKETLAKESEALIQAVPEWKDSTKAKAEKQMLIEFGQKIGYSEDELKNVFDHRAVVTLRKAALYDQMMSKRKDIKPVVNNGPRPVKPSAAGRVSTTTEGTRAKQRLAKTGRVDDAAKAIELLLK
jgi:hypothetical protein